MERGADCIIQVPSSRKFLAAGASRPLSSQILTEVGNSRFFKPLRSSATVMALISLSVNFGRAVASDDAGIEDEPLAASAGDCSGVASAAAFFGCVGVGGSALLAVAAPSLPVRRRFRSGAEESFASTDLRFRSSRFLTMYISLQSVNETFSTV